MSGCSHPLEVDVPANVHGRVIVMCESFSAAASPIRVNAEGLAEHAACPTSQSSLVVVRDGQPVKPVSSPNWSTTGDGILLSVDFELP